MSEKNIPVSVALKIHNILNDFGFSKVIKVMECLDWQYAVPKTHYPDEAELKETAFKYMVDVYNGFWNHKCKEEKFFTYSLSTGGFEYTYWYDFEDKQDCFEVRFVVEEYREF